MKKLFTTTIFIFSILSSFTQTIEDVFNSDVKLNWLGVDFYQVKLIGDFSQFFGAGQKSSVQIRDNFFPEWNRIIIAEPDKYKLKELFHKSDIWYDPDMIMARNSEAPINNMEVWNAPNYDRDTIQKFVKSYSLKGKKGLGLVFIAEALNKSTDEGVFHIVALNMETKQVLLSERVTGKPSGFGIKNYWLGAIASIIKEAIKKEQYSLWKSKYLNR